MRILIIEDNIDFQRFLRRRLEEKCFAVDTADSGSEGLRQARSWEYDLILLDYALPEKNGYEICHDIRSGGTSVPIILISATNAVTHKIDGFSHGIDDYLVKPFFFEELLARIHAILRRPARIENSRLVFEDLSLDPVTQKVRRGSTDIYLTRKEFSLLEYMLRHPRTVVSRGDLMDHVWDTEVDVFSKTIETHIMNLRRKIDLPRRRKLIHSLSGRGYKLDTLK